MASLPLAEIMKVKGRGERDVCVRERVIERRDERQGEGGGAKEQESKRVR